MLTKEMVRKYLETDDNVIELTKEELEDNAEFMSMVIEESKDPKMFLVYASDNVKKDSMAVLSALKVCKNDTDLMCRVCKNYLLDHDTDRETIEYKEIIFYVDKFNFFDNECIGIKDKEISQIEEFISTESNRLFEEDLKKVKNENAKFAIISKNNDDSPIVKEYFAKWFLYDYFSGDDSIEANIHSTYKDLNPKEISDLNQFIYKFLCSKDIDLTVYLMLHESFLDNTKKELKKIFDRWEVYNTRYNQDKAADFCKKL